MAIDAPATLNFIKASSINESIFEDVNWAKLVADEKQIKRSDVKRVVAFFILIIIFECYVASESFSCFLPFKISKTLFCFLLLTGRTLGKLTIVNKTNDFYQLNKVIR